MTDQTPRTEAGRALNANLAYDYDPVLYLPGDYIERYREAILAIEAEAAAPLDERRRFIRGVVATALHERKVPLLDGAWVLDELDAAIARAYREDSDD